MSIQAPRGMVHVEIQRDVIINARRERMQLVDHVWDFFHSKCFCNKQGCLQTIQYRKKKKKEP